MSTPLEIVSETLYFIIYIICLCFCFKAGDTNIQGLTYIRIMLCCGFLTEVAVLIFKTYHFNENRLYYVYIPVEYCLLVFFYAENTSKKLLKSILHFSIVAYLAICYLFISFDGDVAVYPASIYNSSCFLNTVWITILFFDFENKEDIPITRLPLFWIYTGLLIFYAGIFFFNGAYNYFVKNDFDLAKKLRLYINTGLNYVLYSVLTYSFLCSKKNTKKYC